MVTMQPKIEAFNVTCLKCKGQSRIRIINSTEVMYVDHTPIISCRLRGDMKWGFECMCGNDSRLAREEKNDLPLLVQHPDPEAKKNIMDQLIKTLEVKDEHKFVMSAA